MGMSIVNNLVRQMKGQLLVESEYGKGSEFTVILPQTVVDWRGIGDICGQKKQQIKGKRALFYAPEAEILLVDDNAVNLKVVSSLLKRTKVKKWSVR